MSTVPSTLDGPNSVPNLSSLFALLCSDALLHTAAAHSKCAVLEHALANLGNNALTEIVMGNADGCMPLHLATSCS